MKARTYLFKISVLIAPLAAALAMGGPAAQAVEPSMAGSPVVVATSLSPSDCGKYHTAQFTDLSAAVAGKTKGTILVCPGTYGPLASLIQIAPNAKNLTIKRALTGAGSRPVIMVNAAALAGIRAADATNLVVDGLIFDMSSHPVALSSGFDYSRVSGSVRNVTFIGSINTSYGLQVNNSGLSKVKNVTVSNSAFLGYSTDGLLMSGKGKLIAKGNLLDGTDGGRLAVTPSGVMLIALNTDNPGPTGIISKNTILNNASGVYLNGASKTTISSNVIFNSANGVVIVTSVGYHSADNNKITGNTISVPAPGAYGIFILDIDVGNATILKTTITRNVISSTRYTPSGGGPRGVHVEANMSAPTRVTATISKNTFIGFPTSPTPLYIVNLGDFAGLKIGSNERTP